MGAPDIFVMLLKASGFFAPKKQMEFLCTTIRVVEADAGLIVEYCSADGSSFASWHVRRQRWSGVSQWHWSGRFDRYPTAAKRPCTVQTKACHPDRLISSTLILDAESKLFHLMIQGRAWSVFDVIVFNRHSHSPWIRLLFSLSSWHGTFEMAACDTLAILDISLSDSPRLENQTIFSIITEGTLVGMIATIAVSRLQWNGFHYW